MTQKKPACATGETGRRPNGIAMKKARLTRAFPFKDNFRQKSECDAKSGFRRQLILVAEVFRAASGPGFT